MNPTSFCIFRLLTLLSWIYFVMSNQQSSYCGFPLCCVATNQHQISNCCLGHIFNQIKQNDSNKSSVFIIQFCSDNQWKVSPVVRQLTFRTYLGRWLILPVVYGCETWSLKLREECRLRVFENRVLRGILELKRDEVTEEWRKLHNEELHDLYSSSNIVRVKKNRELDGRGM